MIVHIHISCIVFQNRTPKNALHLLLKQMVKKTTTYYQIILKIMLL